MGVGNEPSNTLSRTVDRVAPVVTLTSPSQGSTTGDTTPALSGVGGTTTGDNATITVRVYAGSTTSGSLLQTRTATRDAGSGAYAVDATTLGLGTYTAVASQVDSAGNQGTSPSTTFTIVDTTPPAPPAGVTVTPRSTGLFVDWADSSATDLAGYDIYRSSASDGTFTKLNGARLTTSQYLDTSAPTGATSFYEVRATDLSGNSSAPGTANGARPSIAFRSASSAHNSGATSLVLPRPAGVVSGDVLVAALSIAGNPSITVPTGWTLIQNQVSGSNLRQVVYVRVAAAGENASYTWAFSSSVTAAGIIDAYVGVDPAQPVDVSGGLANASSTSILAPSISKSTGVLLIGFFGTLTNATIAPPTGMVEQAETVATGKQKLALETADQILGVAALTGTRTASADKAAVNIGQTIVLRAIGAATPTGHGGPDAADERGRHRDLLDPGRPDLDGLLGQRRARSLRDDPQRWIGPDRHEHRRPIQRHLGRPRHDLHVYRDGR